MKESNISISIAYDQVQQKTVDFSSLIPEFMLLELHLRATTTKAYSLYLQQNKTLGLIFKVPKAPYHGFATSPIAYCCLLYLLLINQSEQLIVISMTKLPKLNCFDGILLAKDIERLTPHTIISSQFTLGTGNSTML